MIQPPLCHEPLHQLVSYCGPRLLVQPREGGGVAEEGGLRPALVAHPQQVAAEEAGQHLLLRISSHRGLQGHQELIVVTINNLPTLILCLFFKKAAKYFVFSN